MTEIHRVDVVARLKTPPPRVDLKAVASVADAEVRRIYGARALADDLRYLQGQGISIASVARQLGLDRQRLYQWMKGVPPMNPWYLLCVREWARQVREKVAERQLGLKAEAHFK